MSRIITSIVLLAIMTAGCLYSVKTVSDFSDDMIKRIHAVEKAFEDKDTDKCTEEAKQLRDRWKQFTEHAILINDLGHAIEITSSVAEIYSFAQESNEELYASCDRAQAQIEMFKDMQVPTLWKIL